MKMIKKIDWYSVMLYGTTLRKILEFYGYDPSVYEYDDGMGMLDVFNCSKLGATCRASCLRIMLPCVKIEIPISSAMQKGVDLCDVSDVKPGDSEGDDLAAVVGNIKRLVDKDLFGVRLEMAGQQLDIFRLSGHVPEIEFADPLFWVNNGIASERNVTRVDFAYDFLDYPRSLSRDLCVFINEQLAVGEKGFRFQTEDRRPPLCCKTNFDATETCSYLGATGSGNVVFLRVYDKLQERTEKAGPPLMWPDYVASEYRACLSWDRFELQARGTKAVELLFRLDPVSGKYLAGEDLMDEVWYHITTHYCICDTNKTPLPWLREFYNEVNEYVKEQAHKRLNENFVQLGATLGGVESGCAYKPKELGEALRIESFYERNKMNIIELILAWGVDGLIDCCNVDLDILRNSELASDRRRFLTLEGRIKSLEAVLDVPRCKMAGGTVIDGKFHVVKDKMEGLGNVPELDPDLDLIDLYECVAGDYPNGDYSEVVIFEEQYEQVKIVSDSEKGFF